MTLCCSHYHVFSQVTCSSKNEVKVSPTTTSGIFNESPSSIMITAFTNSMTNETLPSTMVINSTTVVFNQSVASVDALCRDGADITCV